MRVHATSAAEKRRGLARVPQQGLSATCRPNCSTLGEYSSPTWTRTTDMVINSHPLYQLSYRGICPSARLLLLAAASMGCFVENGGRPVNIQF
jgi:hypothetical protein